MKEHIESLLEAITFAIVSEHFTWFQSETGKIAIVSKTYEYEMLTYL